MSSSAAPRIIIVYDYAYISGGQAKVALESAVGLANAGHDVTYFAAAGPAWPELERAGVKLICLDQKSLLNEPNPLRAAAQGIWNKTAATQLAKLLATRTAADTVVHVHGWAKALSPSIGPILRRSGLPIVYTMHEYFLACPTGCFYDFNLERNCPLTPLSLACVTRNCDARRYTHKIWRVARQAVLKGFSGLPGDLRHIIYISNLQRRVMSPYLPAGATLHNVSNPVSVAQNGPSPIPADGKENPFVFVGRLSREKGGVIFAQAAQRANVPAVFIGEGPCADDIRAANPAAEITGWLAPADVMTRLRSARALVFPSLWYECQPLTVYEALANGIPAIVSDNCAAREAIRDGETGVTFQSGNISALADQISRLAQPGIAARMGASAYENYWRDPLTLERHIAGLERVYALMRA